MTRRKALPHSARARSTPQARQPALAEAFGLPELARRRPNAVALTVMAVLAVAALGGAPWSAKLVLGHLGADMSAQFLGWRFFGFGEWTRGHLPLWNPGIYAGEPYFGGMQAALLYPPNVLFFLLPVVAAINWSYALNLWLMGALLFAWARHRGLGAAAAFFGGAIGMLCGANVPQIYGGHPSYGSTMAWAPLIFLSIDGWLDRRRAAWLLAGMGGVAMQILAGHGQYIFYTGIAAGLYAFLRLFQSKRRLGGALGMLAIYPGGAALAAIQLLTAMQAISESTRNVALPWRFASSFGFPPENFLTLVAPNVFGPLRGYWGRGLAWEMSLFIGVTGVAMALRAATGSAWRRAWPLWTVTAVTLVLAVGNATPLLWLLYRHVPGFNMFRGLSKFIFPASVMLAMLSATGLDGLSRGERTPPWLTGVVAALTVALAACAAWPCLASPDAWLAFMRGIMRPGECFASPSFLNDAALRGQAQHGAATSLLLAASTGACVVAALALRKRHPIGAAWGLIVLGVLEMTFFARGAMDSFDPDALVPPEMVERFVSRLSKDDRILNMVHPNVAMLIGANDAWGSDPSVTRRYAEFVAWTQGLDPNDATQDVPVTTVSPLLFMTRLRYVLAPEGNRLSIKSANAYGLKAPLPRVLVAPAWRVLPGRDAIFAAMLGKGFAPWREALLEHDPGLGGASAPPPPGALAGSARVVAETTDSLTIEAETPTPAILTITDAWAQSWRARALPGSSQASYRLIPTDYWMRGVPLAPGRHKLIVEYAPRAFVVGAWISALALIGYGAAWIVALRRMRREEAVSLSTVTLDSPPRTTP